MRRASVSSWEAGDIGGYRPVVIHNPVDAATVVSSRQKRIRPPGTGRKAARFAVEPETVQPEEVRSTLTAKGNWREIGDKIDRA
jgi:hypothetical protein